MNESEKIAKARETLYRGFCQMMKGLDMLGEALGDSLVVCNGCGAKFPGLLGQCPECGRRVDTR
jgi:rubrerythrin